MYTYICICIYICIHVWICVYIWLHEYIYIDVHIHICIYTHVYICIDTYVHIYIYIYVFWHSYTEHTDKWQRRFWTAIFWLLWFWTAIFWLLWFWISKSIQLTDNLQAVCIHWHTGYYAHMLTPCILCLYANTLHTMLYRYRRRFPTARRW